NATVVLSATDYRNFTTTDYRNLNRFRDVYRFSTRTNATNGATITPTVNLNYKWKKAANTRENLDLFTAVVLGKSDNERIYYQQFKTNDGQPTGVDSAQRQINDNSNGVFELRANYNKPITKKILLSGGVSVHGSINNNNLVTAIQP